MLAISTTTTTTASVGDSSTDDSGPPTVVANASDSQGFEDELGSFQTEMRATELAQLGDLSVELQPNIQPEIKTEVQTELRTGTQTESTTESQRDATVTSELQRNPEWLSLIAVRNASVISTEASERKPSPDFEPLIAVENGETNVIIPDDIRGVRGHVTIDLITKPDLISTPTMAARPHDTVNGQQNVAVGEISVNKDPLALETSENAPTRAHTDQPPQARQPEAVVQERSVSSVGTSSSADPNVSSPDDALAPTEATVNQDAVAGRSTVQVPTPNAEAPSVNQSVLPRDVVSISNLGSSSSMSHQIADHIVSARQSMQDGNVKLEVLLDPPELGKITIELTESGDQLRGRLLVSEHATLDTIKSTLPALFDSLTEAGLSLEDMQLESSAQHDHSRFEAENNSQESKKMPDRTAETVLGRNVTRSIGVDILV